MCTPIVCTLAKLFVSPWGRPGWINTGVEGALVLCIDRTPPLSKCLRILSLARGSGLGGTNAFSSYMGSELKRDDSSARRLLEDYADENRRASLLAQYSKAKGQVDANSGSDAKSTRSNSVSKLSQAPPSPRLPSANAGGGSSSIQPGAPEAVTLTEAEFQSNMPSHRIRASSENVWDVAGKSRRRDSDIASTVTLSSLPSSSSSGPGSRYLEELFCEELYEGFQFRQLTPTFYSFPIPDGVIGLAFSSAAEAERFVQRVHDLAPRRSTLDSDASPSDHSSTGVLAKIGRWLLGGSTDAKQISAPESFQHQMHLGIDGDSFFLESAPAEWKAVFEAVGLEARHLKNPPLMAAVLKAVAGASAGDDQSDPDSTVSNSMSKAVATTTTEPDTHRPPSPALSAASTSSMMRRAPPPPSRPPPPPPSTLPPLVPSRRKHVETALREAIAQYGDQTPGSESSTASVHSAITPGRQPPPPRPTTLPPPPPPGAPTGPK